MLKQGPHIAYISVFSILLVFCRLFCAFFGNFLDCFPLILGYSIEIYILMHFHFSFFSECWQLGLLQLRFQPWLKPLGTPQVYNLNFLKNF